MERREQIIVDVSPEDVFYEGNNIKGNVTGSREKFAIKTLGYGLRILLNFLGWAVKSVVSLTIEGFKAASEGSRELNDEIRRGRPRFDKSVVSKNTDIAMPFGPGVEYEIRLKKRF